MTDEATGPWLTVVTVVKDDPSGFARTARSLVARGTDGVQWVVIDSSTDVNEVPRLIMEHPDLQADYAWEPPEGIYAAMNSGLAKAQGEYVLFLNAGDQLHGPGVLAELRTGLRASPMWAYGHVAFASPGSTGQVPPPFDYRDEKAHRFSRGRFPPHQGTVARSAILRQMGAFNTSYRIAADYAAFLRLSRLADPLELDVVIADFETGGASSTAWLASLREFHKARATELDLTGIDRLRDAAATCWLGAKMGVARALGRV